MLLSCLLTMAHIGNPDAVYDGQAGPYGVRVIVRAPVVIPQRADIIVRVLSGTGVQHVRASARFWDAGAQGAPPPEEASRVPGDSSVWSVSLWLMRQGSYGITVEVAGDLGRGTVLVPVTATATIVKPMSRSLGALIITLVGVLVVGILSIVGAAGREATLEGGRAPDDAHRAAASRAQRRTALIIVATVIGFAVWWRTIDAQHRRVLFRPAPMSVTTHQSPQGTVVRLGLQLSEPRRVMRIGARADDEAEAEGPSDRTTPIVPDHGKLMHLFAVSADQSVLLHLHPVRTDSVFEATLPPVREGLYRFYADVVHESGFSQTLVGQTRVAVPPATWTPSDSDDAFGDATVPGLPDGLHVETGALAGLVAGRDVTLSFTIKDGVHVASVEPYLGMAGHAVVVRDSGDVFAHIHPTGTTSMTAQRVLASAVAPAAGAMRMSDGVMPGVLRFPFVFPKAGSYALWIQFRYGGVIRTVPFSVTVKDR